MKLMRKRTMVPFLALAGLLFVGGSPAQGQSQDDAMKAQELVKRIRRGMREIDQILLTGGDTGAAAEELEANARRIDELLREAESKSDSVIAGIDELIEMAKPPS